MKKMKKSFLEPIKEIPKKEEWLFDPQNKAVVDELKRALKQKADRKIDLDDLEKEFFKRDKAQLLSIVQ